MTKEQTKIKAENFIVIQGWMISLLKLKGNELIIYAIIYGFSQAENQTFTGSLQYLADWTNSTKQGVIKNLKSLIAKGYIVKEEKFINGVKFCEYHTTKFNEGIKQNLIGIKQSLTGGIKQSLTNNIDNNNINNNIYNINNGQSIDQISSPSDEKILKDEFDKLWIIYPRKEKKELAFKTYKKYRTSKSKDYITFEEVEKGIQNYNRYISINNIEHKYIKQGSTYFNNRCWNDELNIKEEKIPDWFGKDIVKPEATEEEMTEMEQLLSQYQ